MRVEGYSDMRTQSDGILHFNDDEQASLSYSYVVLHTLESSLVYTSTKTSTYLPAPSGLRTIYEASPYLPA